MKRWRGKESGRRKGREGERERERPYDIFSSLVSNFLRPVPPLGVSVKQ